MSKILTEICVDSVESGLAAQRAGADRIELCQALNIGGLSPSRGLFMEIRRQIDLPILCMVRPRSGDFLYSDYEKNIILEDIRLFKELGADGLVLGSLKADASIDLEFMKKVMELADGLPVSFHRAFDMTRNLEEALEDLIDLGVARVLTSGGRPSAYEGRKILARLVDQASSRIEIVAGAGVNRNNVRELVEDSSVRSLHFSAKTRVESSMVYRNQELYMGEEADDSEYSYNYTYESEARAIIEIVSGMEC